MPRVRMTNIEILLTLAIFCAMIYIIVTVNHSISGKSFLQIWVPRDQRNKIEEICQDRRKEVIVKYRTGAEMVLPCSAIIEE